MTNKTILLMQDNYHPENLNLGQILFNSIRLTPSILIKPDVQTLSLHNRGRFDQYTNLDDYLKLIQPYLIVFTATKFYTVDGEALMFQPVDYIKSVKQIYASDAKAPEAPTMIRLVSEVEFESQKLFSLHLGIEAVKPLDLPNFI